MRPVDLLIEQLKAEQARGTTHVLLDEEARDGLRELFLKTRAMAKVPSTQPTPAASAAPASSASTSPSPTPTTTGNNHRIVVEGGSRMEKLDSLRRQAEQWAPARSLGTLRDTMVFATGNPEARLMLVGEAPGHEEERRQEPFVGPAGQKLNDILKAMGLAREEVYISNIVKFRPLAPRQTTNNRKPSAEEMAACLPFVLKEIEIVKPDCIVALGGTAAEGLLALEGAVGAMRGHWHAVDGIPTRVTYHPSYLLQSGSGNDVKRKVWEDMLEVMEKLGLPISDKQRGYFLPKS